MATPFSTMRFAVAASAPTVANAMMSRGTMPMLPRVSHPFRCTDRRLNRPLNIDDVLNRSPQFAPPAAGSTKRRLSVPVWFTISCRRKPTVRDVLKSAHMRRPKDPEPGWVAWLREQIAYGADFAEVKAFLNNGGIPDPAIAAAVEALRPLDSALARGQLDLPPLIRRAPRQLRQLNVPGLDLYTLDHFMSPKECRRVAALAA